MLFLWLAPVILAVLFLLGFIGWLVANGGLGFPWFRFYAKGKESGFQFNEINTLRKAAVEAEMENPVTIFSSVRVLDRAIRSLILRFRARQKMEEPASAHFLGEIFDFRRRVEFNLPRYRNGIKTSRELMAGQRIRCVRLIFATAIGSAAAGTMTVAACARVRFVYQTVAIRIQLSGGAHASGHRSTANCGQRDHCPNHNRVHSAAKCTS